MLCCLWRPHPVRVLLAVDGALPAAGIVLVGPVVLVRQDPPHQVLLHHFHLLLLGLLGFNLVHKFGPSLLQLVGWILKSESHTGQISADFNHFIVMMENLRPTLGMTDIRGNTRITYTSKLLKKRWSSLAENNPRCYVSNYRQRR